MFSFESFSFVFERCCVLDFKVRILWVLCKRGFYKVQLRFWCAATLNLPTSSQAPSRLLWICKTSGLSWLHFSRAFFNIFFFFLGGGVLPFLCPVFWIKFFNHNFHSKTKNIPCVNYLWRTKGRDFRPFDLLFPCKNRRNRPFTFTLNKQTISITDTALHYVSQCYPKYKKEWTQKQVFYFKGQNYLGLLIESFFLLVSSFLLIGPIKYPKRHKPVGLPPLNIGT